DLHLQRHFVQPLDDGQHFLPLARPRAHQQLVVLVHRGQMHAAFGGVAGRAGILVAAIVAASLQQSAFQPTAGCTTAAESIVGTAAVLAAAVVAAVAVHPAKAVVGDPLLTAQTAAA